MTLIKKNKRRRRNDQKKGAASNMDNIHSGRRKQASNRSNIQTKGMAIQVIKLRYFFIL